MCQSATGRGVSAAAFDSYSITVNPGCQNSTGLSKTYSDGQSSEVLSYELRCGEISVLIRRGELMVNGKLYGALVKGDQIAVDDGKVFINAKEVQSNAPRL